VANSIRVFAPAKINLFLHVGEKRSDGYHALQSLAVFVRDVGDELEFGSAFTLELVITGPHGTQLSADNNNLVLRAARALDANRGAKVVLTKNLPVASGIGGGSADAAATLRGLAQLWNHDADDAQLVDIAAGIGSDVPVCVKSEPAWMEGRGEILTPALPMPDMPIVLVNPRVEVQTGKVFAALTKRRGTEKILPSGFPDADALLAYLAQTSNDLEAPARTLAPVIGNVLDALSEMPGARLARMSGSGATCFALFDNREHARDAMHALRKAHPGWWVEAGETALTPQ
jgi:4-diphosphocytidyl-2-C-methyl-D-erythritol kinase